MTHANQEGLQFLPVVVPHFINLAKMLKWQENVRRCSSDVICLDIIPNIYDLIEGRTFNNNFNIRSFLLRPSKFSTYDVSHVSLTTLEIG